MEDVDSKKAICLAIDNFGGLTSTDGIGTRYDQIAKVLAGHGWDVVILSYNLTGENVSNLPERYFKEYGIRVYNAKELYRENIESPDDVWRDSNWYQARSHIFDKALQVLNKKDGYKFDLIEFPEIGAGGFIPIRAKYSRDGDGTRFIVKLHGPSQWQRDGSMLEAVTIDDLKLDYMEKYAFENADIQVSSTQFLVNWVQEHGWKMNSDVSVCLNPVRGLNKFNSPGLYRDLTKHDRIVYGGRFESGNEIYEFINALNYAAGQDITVLKQYKITFPRTEGPLSINYVKESLGQFEVEFLNLSSEQEFQFLTEQARLVVVPSRGIDCFDKVSECISARIPFITTRNGVIFEVLRLGNDLYESFSCDTSKPEIFGACILRYLSYDHEQLDKLLEAAYHILGNTAASKQIVSWYNEKLREGATLEKPKKGFKSSPIKQEASVTIIIPFYNTQKYVVSTLDSIYRQTYKNFKVICVNDGSTDPDAISMLDYIRHRYPEVMILDKKNGGVGSALNYALPHVTSKYVIEVDADNIVKPNMMKTFVECMENRQDLAALSCYFMTFRDEDERQMIECINISKEYTSGSFYKALGPCLPVLFFENCAGDANSIYCTKALSAIGGWPETRKGVQDWGLWIKLLANGYSLDVVPDVLFYYRQHTVSEIKTKTNFGLDEANIELIYTLIEKNPRLFSSSCYEGLHRLIRGSQTNKVRIKDLEIQINQMNHSTAIQLIKRYRRMVDRLLPIGTHRRNLYRFGLRSVRVILNEGLKVFGHKAINYIRNRHYQKGAVPVD